VPDGAFLAEVDSPHRPSLFDQLSQHTRREFVRQNGFSENICTPISPIWHETFVPMEDADSSAYLLLPVIVLTRTYFIIFQAILEKSSLLGNHITRSEKAIRHLSTITSILTGSH